MLVAATLAATLACAASPLDSPNVVLIVVDTLRPDHMSTYGYERKTTPNISRLAQDSILFRNAWSTAPWTLPSVGSLLTSQYPSALGIRDNIVPLDRRFELLPEVLQRRGYRTHGIVSSALLSARLGFGRGFDHYDESSSLFHSGSSSREVTRKAVEFLKARDDRPFFLFLHYFDPHYNYELHPRFRFGSGYRGRLRSGHSILDLWRIRHQLDAADLRFLVSLYDSEVAYTDESIGMLLDELRILGLYDDALIVLTADHGEEFMERGWIGHSITLHREQLWIPLVIKLPDGEAREVESPISTIDVVPSLYRQLGIDLPDGLEGRALPLDAVGAFAEVPIYGETFNRQKHRRDPVERVALRSVSVGGLKLIADEVTGRVVLFDLGDDPEERVDLASERADQVDRLQRLLGEWTEHVERKRNPDAPVPGQDLLTPEQRQQLKALGYL